MAMAQQQQSDDREFQEWLDQESVIQRQRQREAVVDPLVDLTTAAVRWVRNTK